LLRSSPSASPKILDRKPAIFLSDQVHEATGLKLAIATTTFDPGGMVNEVNVVIGSLQQHVCLAVGFIFSMASTRPSSCSIFETSVTELCKRASESSEL